MGTPIKGPHVPCVLYGYLFMYHEGSHNFLWHFLNLMFLSSQIIVYLLLQLFYLPPEVFFTGCIICLEVLFRIYLRLALVVNNRLFIGSVCFMVVDTIKVRAL